MVRLVNEDVASKEVLAWKGLHLFHAHLSSCSQKLRIFMNLKGIEWSSHPVDLHANEHLEPYFLGINPRGVVPVLIDDGRVHIESNDILLHLEQRFPEPQLIPAAMHEDVASALRHENDLHFDLRTLSFRFLFEPGQPPKTQEDLDRYARNGTGTVQGRRDDAIDREIAFWRSYLDHGIDDQAARRSAHAFRSAFATVDSALANHDHILGSTLSLLDIAWLVYAQRLTYAGYPIATLHPHVEAWRRRLMMQPPIAQELRLPSAMSKHVTARRSELAAAKRTLADICFPELTHAATARHIPGPEE